MYIDPMGLATISIKVLANWSCFFLSSDSVLAPYVLTCVVTFSLIFGLMYLWKKWRSSGTLVAALRVSSGVMDMAVPTRRVSFFSLGSDGLCHPIQEKDDQVS